MWTSPFISSFRFWEASRIGMDSVCVFVIVWSLTCRFRCQLEGYRDVGLCESKSIWTNASRNPIIFHFGDFMGTNAPFQNRYRTQCASHAWERETASLADCGLDFRTPNTISAYSFLRETSASPSYCEYPACPDALSENVLNCIPLSAREFVENNVMHNPF